MRQKPSSVDDDNVFFFLKQKSSSIILLETKTFLKNLEKIRPIVALLANGLVVLAVYRNKKVRLK